MKNSSKQVTNNEVLNLEVIKAQLKAACQGMNAKETKEYIKGLDGYELRLTGQKPTQHYTVFYGEVRICNVEQIQGIKADGTARGCISVAKVNFLDKVNSYFAACIEKLQLTDGEKSEAESAFEAAFDHLQAVQSVFDSANERARAEAEAAAKEKRAAAAKERAQKKVGEKIAAGSDSEKIAAIAAALGVSYEVATKIYKEQKQTA